MDIIIGQSIDFFECMLNTIIEHENSVAHHYYADSVIMFRLDRFCYVRKVQFLQTGSTRGSFVCRIDARL